MPGGMWACDRVQRIGRREGLKVPPETKAAGQALGLNDGSCFRLRPERRNHVWTYDFVETQTHDGCKLRLMTKLLIRRATLMARYSRVYSSISVACLSTFGLTTALK
jgi:putative transposase